MRFCSGCIFGLSGLSRPSGLFGLFRLSGLFRPSGLSRLFGLFRLSRHAFAVWVEGDGEDHGPVDRIEKSVGGQLEVLLHDAVEHQRQNAHEPPKPDVTLGFPGGKGENSGNCFEEEEDEKDY